MKKLALMAVFVMAAFCATAQEMSRPKRIIIIDGKFFS